jgi:hypothetical protein
MQPFADDDLKWLHWFPPAHLLVSAVALAGVVAASVIIGYLGCILVHSQLSR